VEVTQERWVSAKRNLQHTLCSIDVQAHGRASTTGFYEAAISDGEYGGILQPCGVFGISINGEDIQCALFATYTSINFNQ
jgi:hypothetical protein